MAGAAGQSGTTVILLGYASIVMLGLLPLAAFARLTGVADDRVFFLPTSYALVVGFAIGLVVCTLVGRALGLLATDDITRYTAQHRQDVGGAAAARRRLRPRQGRIRSTAAAPFVRFS